MKRYVYEFKRKNRFTYTPQAAKFGNLDNDSDDELGEESLLETPLDKVEPYQLFRDALMSKIFPARH
jgi:hypothetical protein